MKFLIIFVVLVQLLAAEEATPVAEQTVRVAVEGQLVLPGYRNCREWSTGARIILSPNQIIGFVREDCSFRVDNVPNGSFIVQVENTGLVFEPLRVDITARGKMRARRLSLLQPSVVALEDYPLKMTSRSPTRYFRKREEWRITDMLFSPMVLMLVLPLLVMLVIPKMTANDPELKKEMEQMQLPKMDMPDVSEMMANLFGGGPNPANKKKSVTAGSTQRRR
ncbi:unnamed protein product [Caenorhabditis bovis]|uniref:ER membrane protein complex subunit 7 beta-sandwich domain-containing protein n=1 Tax=Caenorhabditis bovis TaxID=2654633 RepID=A0A8S1EN09_9PELO|nr:unnamed protein product [Caenorhabditis bovis]